MAFLSPFEDFHSRDFQTVQEAGSVFLRQIPPIGEAARKRLAWQEHQERRQLEQCVCRNAQLIREPISLLPLQVFFLPVLSCYISLLGLPEQRVRYWVAYTTEIYFLTFPEVGSLRSGISRAGFF